MSNGIPTNPSHFGAAILEDKITYFEEDVRSLQDVTQVIDKIKPDFVFHLAAQPIVRLSYDYPVQTIETNVIGTMNILEALRQVNHKCCAVMITSDKCYENKEWIYGYRETDSLGGKDPYSASKGAAEFIIKTYTHSFFNTNDSEVKAVSARAGNVIGGGDWGQDRIVPDCVTAWSKGEKVRIRNPMATRPWQHVLEPLSGYLLLGEKLFNNRELNGESFNFGPNTNQNHTVGELIKEMQKHWIGTEIDMNQNFDESRKEANLLKLCCDKAQSLLGWYPTLGFHETVKFTIDWYQRYYVKDEDMYNQSYIYLLSRNQIMEYIHLASERMQKGEVE